MTQKQAQVIMLAMIKNFPGLVDLETPVNGPDLVDWISGELYQALTSTKEKEEGN